MAQHSYAGGIVITASHNPDNWNGLKFIDSDGCFLNNEKNLELFKIADNYIHQEMSCGKIIKFNNGYTSHIEHTQNLSVIDSNKIKCQNYTIVVDAINGAASYALPAMLENLGCIVHRLHCKPNGKFFSSLNRK